MKIVSSEFLAVIFSSLIECLLLFQARAGVIGTTAMLRLFASYVNENSYTVWESLTHNLTTLGRLLSSTDYYEDFKKYAVKLFTPTAVRLGWDPKDTDSKT